MKHASQAALSSLASLLAELRLLAGLVERKPGIFYVKSKSYLHFHEDPLGMFADVRMAGDEFRRMPVNTKAEQDLLLDIVAKDRLNPAASTPPSKPHPPR